MDGEFIKPNWHILFVHYPIALVTVGFVAELIGTVFRRPGLRYSARWMIAIGALLGLPTAVLGLYAYRDVVAAGPIDLGMSWSQVVAASAWGQPVYDAMWWHVWLNAVAAALLVIVAVIWIASSPAGRTRTSIPLLGLTFVAVALMAGGAWFGGELVYNHGAGVLAEPGMPAGAVGEPEWLRRYFPPLQLHLLGGGFLAALVMLSIAQSLRFWRVASRARLEAESLRARGAAHPAATEVPLGAVSPEELYPARALREEDARPIRAELEAQPGTAAPRPSTATVRGLWVTTALVGLAVVAGGLWSMLGSLSANELERFLASLGQDQRVLAHSVIGAALVLLPLIPFAMPRLLARSRFVVGTSVLLLTSLLAGQIYVGTLMLYDGHAGPLTGFTERPMTSPVAPDPRPDEPAAPAPEAGRPVEAAGPRGGRGDRWDDDRRDDDRRDDDRWDDDPWYDDR